MTRKKLSHRDFILGFGVLFAITFVSGVAQGQTYNILYSFSGGADGSEPMGRLVQDTAGNLYGTTRNGGTQGLGVAFQLTTSGTEKVLHNFVGGTDGATVQSGLIFDSASNLYGTTDLGGAQNHGVVFKIDSSGSESILHTFVGGTDGIGAPSPLIRDGAGNLFSVTYYGGNGPCDFDGNTGCGTIFKIDASGNESVLYNFAGGADGNPDTALVQDTAGNLYGAARDGEVFELTSSGTEKSLHVFGGRDGSDLRGDLVQDGAGNLYGTAFFGGTSGNGVVFKLDASGNETVLYNFSGGSDGANPQSGVVEDGAGNFYGTTYNGGVNGVGTVFEIDSSGNESVLHSFAGGTDGANPYGGLLLDAMGNLYGTTYGGGISGHGTMFEIGVIPPPSNLSAVVGNGSIYSRWSPSTIPADKFEVDIEYTTDTSALNTESTEMFAAGIGTSFSKVGSVECQPPNIDQAPSCLITNIPNGTANGLPIQNVGCYRLTVTGVYNGVLGAPSQSPIAACPANPRFALAHPDTPIVFLHGFREDGSFTSGGVFYNTLHFFKNTLGWRYGGQLYHIGDALEPTQVNQKGSCPVFNDTGVDPNQCTDDGSVLSQADFFTASFGNILSNYGDSRGLAHQGDEVSHFISKLHIDGITKKISIVAHSNGGLASRYFLTNYAGAPGRIAQLVTYGTPHRGADVDEVVADHNFLCVGNLFCSPFDKSDGALDAKFTCNGTTILYPGRRNFLFLDDLSNKQLPSQIKYTSVFGVSEDNSWPLPDGQRDLTKYPCHSADWDGLVPASSADLSQAEPQVIAGASIGVIKTNQTHMSQAGDFPTILCVLNPNCVRYEVHSPVNIDVVAPDATRMGPSFAGIPGASYMNVVEEGGHETAMVIVPYPQGGQYTIKAFPKPGAQPTDTFTILQIQTGVTTTIAQDMPIQNIPPAGFQTVVKNGTSTLSYSPENVDFGNVVVGRKGKKVVTLENMGSTKATVGLVSLTVTAGNTGDFSITRYCGAPLASGKRCTIAVHFNPQSVETGAATLNIVTDASEVPLQVPITAAGVKR